MDSLFPLYDFVLFQFSNYPSLVIQNYIFNVHNSFSRIFTECDNKTYGLDCRESCGNCSNGEPCHHVDGNCQFGCDDGVFGLKCITGIALQQIYRVQIIFSFIS